MAKAKKAAGDASVEFLETLNELQKLSNRTDLSKLQSGTGALARGVDVCKVYAKAAPFLKIILKIPFIPKKAKDVIRLLTMALDTMCPR